VIALSLTALDRPIRLFVAPGLTSRIEASKRSVIIHHVS
jgi:hypothetical protein